MNHRDKARSKAFKAQLKPSQKAKSRQTEQSTQERPMTYGSKSRGDEFTLFKSYSSDQEEKQQSTKISSRNKQTTEEKLENAYKENTSPTARSTKSGEKKREIKPALPVQEDAKSPATEIIPRNDSIPNPSSKKRKKTTSDDNTSSALGSRKRKATKTLRNKGSKRRRKESSLSVSPKPEEKGARPAALRSANLISSYFKLIKDTNSGPTNTEANKPEADGYGLNYRDRPRTSDTEGGSNGDQVSRERTYRQDPASDEKNFLAAMRSLSFSTYEDEMGHEDRYLGARAKGGETGRLWKVFCDNDPNFALSLPRFTGLCIFLYLLLENNDNQAWPGEIDSFIIEFPKYQKELERPGFVQYDNLRQAQVASYWKWIARQWQNTPNVDQGTMKLQAADLERIVQENESLYLYTQRMLEVFYPLPYVYRIKGKHHDHKSVHMQSESEGKEHATEVD
ncbi:MAG: hypothetical protein Q9227_003922 [Pyrenula ochraceoflavens]